MQGLQREELEQERAERVHVRPGVHGVAAHLLGRHVPRRAHGRAVEAPGGERRAAGGRVRCSRELRPALQFREAPIEEVDLAEVAEHHVARLQVPVDDAARVREVKRLADARERRQQLAPRELPYRVHVPLAERGKDLLEGGAAQALHREVDVPLRIASQVVDRDDRGVLELALHARFAQESCDEIAARRVLAADPLERDVPTDAAVAARVDDPHAALAEHVPERVAKSQRVVVSALQGSVVAGSRHEAAGEIRDGHGGIEGRHDPHRTRPADLLRYARSRAGPCGGRAGMESGRRCGHVH